MPDDRSAEWGRDDWLRLADHLLESAGAYASPGRARFAFPGRPGGYGSAVDGLEGFARTFLLAGFRIAGANGHGVDELIERYATGIATGTDPSSAERWVRLDEHPQAKVEAASIALILDLTRPWVWDRLAPAVRQRTLDYLAPAVGDPTYPRINWVWFRLVVQTFLRSAGGPWSAAEMAEDLASHDGFERAEGWMSDGPERAYDHYCGWALQLYPVLWSRMAGAADLAAGRRERDLARLDRFLLDAIALIGADGSPLLQGRSLVYRFAAAAPFWAGALAGVPSLSPGRLRHAATSVVRHFAGNGVPDERGLLTLGWHGSWPRLAQSYSGPGSPYWASKGFLGIALPADHPVWTAAAEPLPVESGDVLRAVQAPGWLVAGTRADGVVRVVNHGTDHAAEGSEATDSPLYARLGYSTATAPVLDESGWTAPLDQSVVLIDEAGRHSHRTGLRTLAVRVEGEAGVAGSVAEAHWVDAGEPAADHGSGRLGKARPAGRITVWSVVRGAWEVRLIRVDAEPAATRLRIGGWPVTGAGPATADRAVRVTGGRLTSVLAEACDSGGTTTGITTYDDGGPLGSPVRVPWIDVRVPERGRWTAVLLSLSAAPRPNFPAAAIEAAGDDPELRVRWPDGVRTRSRIATPHK
ncbi:DUF2264 domain-containing protein [Actinoplanes sp. NPDC051411]|uniref:DUF2264 domain-containing protein n=1 Tax=Actinoplanes sp. NPDC051411 TaxID=3155522 RepID=UPI0034322BC2